MRYSGYGEEKGVFYIGFLGHLERGGRGKGATMEENEKWGW